MFYSKSKQTFNHRFLLTYHLKIIDVNNLLIYFERFGISLNYISKEIYFRILEKILMKVLLIYKFGDDTTQKIFDYLFTFILPMVDYSSIQLVIFILY